MFQKYASKIMEWNWHSFLLNFQIDIHGLANPEEGSSGNRTGVKASRGVLPLLNFGFVVD